MCGIVGAASKRNVGSILIDGLKKLEYRGYDSAGIAVIDQKNTIKLIRTVGKVSVLEKALQKTPLKGNIGIAHTRWATHGEPAEKNAHPQISKKIAVVHNGIIENYNELKEKLEKLGYEFSSETDTEVIAHLIDYYQNKEKDVLKALRKASSEFEGAYSIGVVSPDEPNKVFAIRHGSPLVIGLGIEENFIGSDPLAGCSHIERFIYLEDGDLAVISSEKFQVFDQKGKKIKRDIKKVSPENIGLTEKGKFKHFMLKEIFEQPKVIRDTLEGRFFNNNVITKSFGYGAEKVFSETKNVLIAACGTSYHAGLVAKYWIESIAGIPCTVEIASEFRYRDVAIHPNTLFITISQSGETADVLAAIKKAKEMPFLKKLSICNVANSALIKESDLHILTRAGREIGVASTKAFTTQLVILLLLSFALSKEKRSLLQDKEWDELLNAIDSVLEKTTEIKRKAKLFFDKKSALFIGRGALSPIAAEGALKLKEISYIHAESYAAGELKHGALALVDQDMPIVVVAPNDELINKIQSNLNEVHARRGELFVFTDNKKMIEKEGIHIIKMPTVHSLLTPILYAIPMQLLAYYVARGKGTDIDQPRNLAKSVTVE